MPITILLSLLAAAAAVQHATAPPPPPAVQRAEIKAVFPHDPAAYTQGLFFADGQLYESTGQYGESTVRKVRLGDGKVLQSASLPADQFGEGSTAWGRQIVSITWQHGIGYRWDRATFRPLGSFRYAGEGWGLTGDGKSLILSDGTPALRFFDPVTFAERRRVSVTVNGRPVPLLNELEYINGEVWANVWKTNLIARIDPASGAVRGWVDLAPLARLHPSADMDNVPNGIAYEPRSKRIFVTGKRWPKLYEIKLKPA